MNWLNFYFNRTGWILVIICITGLASGMGTSKADWCYEEGFEGGGTGLWSDPGIINTTETAAVGEHSIKLEGCSIYPVGTDLPCPEGNKPGVISWWCRAGTLHDCLAVHICPTDSHGMGDLSFHLNHGQFLLYSSPNSYEGFDYNLNQWYFLELYIDWSGEQPVFNMYCDDVLMISNAEPSPWVEFNDVEKIQLEVNCGYSWVDDVKVEQEVLATSTPTETPIPTNTPVPTDTPTNTPEPTCTPTDTPIPTCTPTDTPEPTSTPTDTPEPTCTPTDTPIPTNTPGIPCEHRLYLTDSGHDGWNDGYVDVYVNGLMVIDGATIESIPEKDQKELHWMNYYFDAADNTLIEVEYYQGSYQPEENAYVVYDGMQNVVCESGVNGTIPENTSGPGNCSVHNPTPVPSGTPEPTSTPDPVCINDGDVNNDGSLSATDAQMAFLYAVGFETPDPEQACSADCNGNGSISAGDALSIFMATVGVDSCTDDIPVKRMNNAIQSVSNNLKSETWNAGTIELEYDLTLDNRLEVTIYVNEQNYPVDAFMMEWTVNPDVLRLAGYACTDLTCQWTMLHVQEMSKNTIRIAGFDVGHDDQFHANQAFLKLYFDILDYTIDSQGLIPLKLTGVADDLTDYVIQ